jgi:hypothetical protein
MVDRSSPGSGLPAVGALTKYLSHQGFEPGIDLDLLAVKLALFLEQRKDVVIAFIQFDHEGRQAAYEVLQGIVGHDVTS